MFINKMSRRNIILWAALFLLVIVVVPWWIGKWQRETREDEVSRCLQDPDCRSRTEAAVNEIYTGAGYPTTTLDVLISGSRNHD